MSTAAASTRVLVMDDEPFMIRAVSKVLSQAGFTVYQCEQWSMLSGMVREVGPDLILLDYNMPVLKGDDLCQILKRNAINPNTKVVLYSSEDAAFLADVQVKCGADGWIPKQTPPAELVRRLEAIVN